MRQDRRDVDAAACAPARSTTPSRAGGAPPNCLDAERVRADERDLLEVERRPLEAARRLDAGQRRCAPRRFVDAQPDLERLGLADRVVDDVDAAVQHGQAAPRAGSLRAGLARATRLDQGARRARARSTRARRAARRAAPGARSAPPRARARSGGARAGSRSRAGRACRSRRRAPSPPRAGARAGSRGATRENGSASTAASSLMLVRHRDALRLVRGQERREAARGVAQLPWWMPGARRPSAKFRHCARSPRSHHSQSASPRVAQESHGFSTTRSPTRRRAHGRPDALDRRDHLVAEHLRERDQRGHRVVEASRSGTPAWCRCRRSRRAACAARPSRRPGSSGSGISRSWIGASGPTKARGAERREHPGRDDARQAVLEDERLHR